MVKYLYESSIFICDVKIGEFKSTKPYRYFLKVIGGPRKNSFVSEIALYWGALYQGCSICAKMQFGSHNTVQI